MKVLIIGGSGMLGHKLYQVLGARFDVSATVRKPLSDARLVGVLNPERVIEGVDVTDPSDVERALSLARPDVVVNAAGVIKQKPAASDIELTLNVNSIFPQRLARLSERDGFRLICVSTDCVFKGDRGGYNEGDIPDALDLYGQSKHWGEVEGSDCLTLRTSIIGRSLESSHNLIDWFYSNLGRSVRGFRRAIYSGFPTVILAKIIADLIESFPDLNGLYHVSSEPIDKYSLLSLVKERAGLDVDLIPDESLVIDRSLDSSRFREATGFRPVSWEAMIDEMCSDPTSYPVMQSPII